MKCSPCGHRVLGTAFALWALCVAGGCEMFDFSYSSSDDSSVSATAAREPAPTIEKAAAPPLSAAEQAMAAGNSLAQAGKLDAARAEVERAIAINPTLTVAYLGAGDIDRRQGDYKSAEKRYSKAAELEPSNFDAQYLHGLSLQMLNRLSEAVRAYLRALTIRPDDPTANLNLATAYLQMNEAGQALPYAQRAVKFDPNNPAARTNLGAIYASLGRHADAVTEYQQASELTKLGGPLLLNLADSLGKTGRLEEMANTLRQLVEIEPSAPAFERLGSALFRLRYYDDALVAFRAAAEIDQNYYSALNGIGVCRLNQYVWSGQKDKAALDEALRVLKRSLQIEPRQPKIVDLVSRYQ